MGAAPGHMPYNVGVILRTKVKGCQMSSVTCPKEIFLPNL